MTLSDAALESVLGAFTEDKCLVPFQLAQNIVQLALQLFQTFQCSQLVIRQRIPDYGISKWPEPLPVQPC